MDALTRLRVGSDLEQLRSVTDARAKVLVGHLRTSCGDDVGHGRLFEALAARPKDTAEGSIDSFLTATDDRAELDHIIDVEKVRHTQRFFETYGLHVSAGLLLKSLPEAYACARGAQVLYLTSELISDPARRVRETAQMLISMLTPDPGIGAADRATTTSLHAGGRATLTARRIRLFHAIVRDLFDSDTSLRTRWEDRRQSFADGGGPMLGDPLCQEDQLGTLFTFTVSVFESLELLGVRATDDDRDAWFHVWDVIGRHLGVGVASAFDAREKSNVARTHDHDLFQAPLDSDVSTELMDAIRRRHWGASHEGKTLANALLHEVQIPLPKSLKPVPASMLAYLAGEEAREVLGVRSGGWTQYWVNRMRSSGGVARVTRGRMLRFPGGEVAAIVGREILQMFTEQGNLDVFARDGGTRQFELPDRLCRSWGIHTEAAMSSRPRQQLS